MAQDDPRTRKLTDWIILVFVLVVMGLLITEIGSNVLHAIDADMGPAGSAAAAESRHLSTPPNRAPGGS